MHVFPKWSMKWLPTWFHSLGFPHVKSSSTFLTCLSFMHCPSQSGLPGHHLSLLLLLAPMLPPLGAFFALTPSTVLFPQAPVKNLLLSSLCSVILWIYFYYCPDILFCNSYAFMSTFTTECELLEYRDFSHSILCLQHQYSAWHTVNPQ